MHGSFRAAELIDIDPEMLEQARRRLARHGDKVRFREGSYHGPLPRRDVIATSLALHHVPIITQKRTLYQHIHDALGPSDVFINAEETMSVDSWTRASAQRCAA